MKNREEQAKNDINMFVCFGVGLIGGIKTFQSTGVVLTALMGGLASAILAVFLSRYIGYLIAFCIMLVLLYFWTHL